MHIASNCRDIIHTYEHAHRHTHTHTHTQGEIDGDCSTSGAFINAHFFCWALVWRMRGWRLDRGAARLRNGCYMTRHRKHACRQLTHYLSCLNHSRGIVASLHCTCSLNQIRARLIRTNTNLEQFLSTTTFLNFHLK